ncbi:MAG: PPC domain-containing protein [Treponema sp.]|jgi:hypothetical protein|nr:PPC domain-containing protein [Treponema sp.]
MKRLFFLPAVLLLLLSAVYGQNSVVQAYPVSQLDGAVRGVAADLHKKLAQENAQKVEVGRFTYQDALPSLGIYWTTQLIQELTNIPNRSWLLLAAPAAGADWIISGEIVEIADTVRVYTRLIRSGDRSISAGIQSDFAREAFIAAMLSDGGGSGRRGESPLRDAYEPDGWENPLVTETGVDENTRPVNRTIHSSGDEDFFLITPGGDGSLTLETTGDTDTVMELYDVGSGDLISEDDDGGSGSNARIRRNVRAGNRYIAKVRAYSDNTGSYGFRAWIAGQVRILPDEYENDDDFSSAKEITIGTPQRHTFTTGEDVDWVKFQITRPGRYTIRTRGVNSARLDTYVELFDADRRSIGEDDDGGENLDSLLQVSREAGTYYLKVECLDDGPDQPYTISVEAE